MYVETSGCYQVTDYTHTHNTFIHFNKLFYYLIVPYIYIKNLNYFHPLFSILRSPLLQLQFYSKKNIPLLFLFLFFVHNPLSLVTASSVCIGGKLFNGSEATFHWLHHWIKWQISHNNLYLPVHLQRQLTMPAQWFCDSGIRNLYLNSKHLTYWANSPPADYNSL